VPALALALLLPLLMLAMERVKVLRVVVV